MFYRWPLDWNDYLAWRKSKHQKSEYQNQEEFYFHRMRQMQAQWGFTSLRDEVELKWIKEGMPYYNVHPMLVSKLCRVNLSKIPAHLVEIPRNFSIVNISVAQQHPELTLQDDIPIDRNVAWQEHISAVPKGSWLHSMLMFRPTARMMQMAKIPPLQSPDRLVVFLFDFDIVSEQGIRSWGLGPLLWVDETDTLEDAVKIQQILGKNISKAYTDLLANCMKLAVTIGFMANSNSELIEPDVLSKDRFSFDNTDDEERRRVIAERAQRRGKKGWNVGNDMMFLGTVQGLTRPRTESESEEKRSLKWAHIRSGHPQAVRFGTKHSKVKIMWIRPTIVRDDLPFKKEE